MYILTIIGITLISLAIYKSRKYFIAKKWQKTKGIFIEVGEVSFEELNLYSYPSAFIYPTTKYEYYVNEKKYINSLVSFEIENITKRKGSNEVFWGNWKKGNNVDIYFNPVNHSESVIIPNMLPHRRSHYLAIIISGVLLIVIGYMVNEFFT